MRLKRLLGCEARASGTVGSQEGNGSPRFSSSGAFVVDGFCGCHRTMSISSIRHYYYKSASLGLQRMLLHLLSIARASLSLRPYLWLLAFARDEKRSRELPNSFLIAPPLPRSTLRRAGLRCSFCAQCERPGASYWQGGDAGEQILDFERGEQST